MSIRGYISVAIRGAQILLSFTCLVLSAILVSKWKSVNIDNTVAYFAMGTSTMFFGYFSSTLLVRSIKLVLSRPGIWAIGECIMAIFSLALMGTLAHEYMTDACKSRQNKRDVKLPNVCGVGEGAAGVAIALVVFNINSAIFTIVWAFIPIYTRHGFLNTFAYHCLETGGIWLVGNEYQATDAILDSEPEKEPALPMFPDNYYRHHRVKGIPETYIPSHQKGIVNEPSAIYSFEITDEDEYNRYYL